MVMSGPDGVAAPDAKVWGRRAYVTKESRELANDISRAIARHRPDDVDDPDDPTLADLRRHANAVQPRQSTPDPKAVTLADLLGAGLTYQEAVLWYWFRHCWYDLSEIHYAIEGHSVGGDPQQRRASTRNIRGVLESAAEKLDGVDPGDVQDMADERKRHDRDDHNP